MLEVRARRIERDLEDLQDDPRALFHQLIRLCGICGDRYMSTDYTCVRHKGHSGPHALDWSGSRGFWLRRTLWDNYLDASGERVFFVPSMTRYKLTRTGLQVASFGNWKVYPPVVPPPGPWQGEGTLLDGEDLEGEKG